MAYFNIFSTNLRITRELKELQCCAKAHSIKKFFGNNSWLSEDTTFILPASCSFCQDAPKLLPKSCGWPFMTWSALGLWVTTHEAWSLVTIFYSECQFCMWPDVLECLEWFPSKTGAFQFSHIDWCIYSGERSQNWPDLRSPIKHYVIYIW